MPGKSDKIYPDPLLNQIPSRKVNAIGKNQHVVPYNGKWAVRGARNEKVTSIHNTQKEAINAAQQIAQNQQSEVVIHRPDGTIRDKDSYGSDPNPPKDRKF